MIMDENKLRHHLTRAMAEAVDEVETYEIYFGTPGTKAEFGVARADGVMPADMMLIWDFANYIITYISSHGIDALTIVEQVGNLFVAYLAVRGKGTDFSPQEQEKLKQAVAETLKTLLAEHSK